MKSLCIFIVFFLFFPPNIHQKDVILKVNKWLNKFNLTVSVEDVKEIIHRLKINQNDLNLDITDVGFGISQVLPIIVQGFLAKNNSFTIIKAKVDFPVPAGPVKSK